jgi:hypothetical protein
MQIHVLDIATPHYAVQAELYTALELIRLCDRKITIAMKTIDYEVPEDMRVHLIEGDDGTCDVDENHLKDIRSVCLVQAAILQEICTGVPTLPDRVFADLMAYDGYQYDPPHLGGLALMLQLATRHLHKATKLSAEHDGEEIDDTYRVMNAAYLAVAGEAMCLESSIRGGFREEVLNAIVEGKPVGTHETIRREWMPDLIEDELVTA